MFADIYKKTSPSQEISFKVQRHKDFAWTKIWSRDSSTIGRISFGRISSETIVRQIRRRAKKLNIVYLLNDAFKSLAHDIDIVLVTKQQAHDVWRYLINASIRSKKPSKILSSTSSAKSNSHHHYPLTLSFDQLIEEEGEWDWRIGFMMKIRIFLLMKNWMFLDRIRLLWDLIM